MLHYSRRCKQAFLSPDLCIEVLLAQAGIFLNLPSAGSPNKEGRPAVHLPTATCWVLQAP